FLASWPQAGVPLGLFSATAVLTVCKELFGEAFLDWGWRVPFFLSGLLIAVGLLIRLRILETPLFRRLQQDKQVATAPLREVLSRHWREILLAAGTRLTENACFYLFSTFIVTYGRTVLNVADRLILKAILLAAAAEFVTTPLFGLLSDRLTRRRTYM